MALDIRDARLDEFRVDFVEDLVDFVDLASRPERQRLEEALKKCRRPKAVMAVHLFGASFDVESILAICRKFSVPLIEDAAQAFGATHAGKPVGTLGAIGCFSLQQGKHITTGEGGMAVTRDPELARRMRVMRLHGMSRDAFDRFVSKTPAWYYEIVAPGFKYNLTDIASSLGLHQLQRARGFQVKRQQLADQFVTGGIGLGRAALLHFTQPVLQRFDQHLATGRVVQQIVLQIRVALDHPDVAQHLVEHACGSAGAALLAQLVEQLPGLVTQQANDDLAVGEAGVVVGNLTQTRRVGIGLHQVLKGGGCIHKDRLEQPAPGAGGPSG